MRKLWNKTKTLIARHSSSLLLLLVVLCSISFSSAFFVSSASAVNFYAQPQKLSLRQHNSNWIRFSNDNNQDVSGQGASGFSFTNNQYSRTFTKPGHLTKLSFYWNNTIDQGSYFYTFDINFHSDISTFYYYGLESQYSGKVYESCRDSSGAEFSSDSLNPSSSGSGSYTGGSETVAEFHELSCHYIFYSFDIMDHFTSIDYAKILTVLPVDSALSALGVQPAVTMTITGGSYYPMTWDAFTDNDKAYIDTFLDDLDDSVNNPDYIEQEKQDLEDAKDEAEDQAESSGSQSESQGTSLISIITGFVSAIATPSGNCNIDLDLTGYGAGHNNVNLCSLSPPSGITALLSVIVVGFVIVAVIHTIEAMISIYREYQS